MATLKIIHQPFFITESEKFGSNKFSLGGKYSCFAIILDLN